MIKRIKKQLKYLILVKTLFILTLLFSASSLTFANASFELQFSITGDKFISSRSGNIEIWETQTGKLLKSFESTDQTSWEFASFTSTGKNVFLIDNKDHLFWLNTTTGRITNGGTLKRGNSYAMSNDKEILAVSRTAETGTANISLYHVGERKLSLKNELKNLIVSISGIYFLKDNKELLTVDFSPKIISLAKGKIRKDFSGLGTPDRSAVAPDLNSLLVFDNKYFRETKPYILDLTTGKKSFLSIDEQYKQLLFEINVIGYSPTDSETIFIGTSSKEDDSGILLIWNTKTEKTVRVLTTKKEIVSAAFTPDGNSILYQDLANNMILADLITGKEIQKYTTSSQTKKSQSTAQMVIKD